MFTKVSGLQLEYSPEKHLPGIILDLKKETSKLSSPEFQNLSVYRVLEQLDTLTSSFSKTYEDGKSSGLDHDDNKKDVEMFYGYPSSIHPSNLKLFKELRPGDNKSNQSPEETHLKFVLQNMDHLVRGLLEITPNSITKKQLVMETLSSLVEFLVALLRRLVAVPLPEKKIQQVFLVICQTFSNLLDPKKPLYSNSVNFSSGHLPDPQGDWLHLPAQRLPTAEFVRWKDSLNVGDTIDAADFQNRWLPAVVHAVTPDFFIIRFLGWSYRHHMIVCRKTLVDVCKKPWKKKQSDMHRKHIKKQLKKLMYSTNPKLMEDKQGNHDTDTDDDNNNNESKSKNNDEEDDDVSDDDDMVIRLLKKLHDADDDIKNEKTSTEFDIEKTRICPSGGHWRFYLQPDDKVDIIEHHCFYQGTIVRNPKNEKLIQFDNWDEKYNILWTEKSGRYVRHGLYSAMYNDTISTSLFCAVHDPEHIFAVPRPPKHTCPAAAAVTVNKPPKLQFVSSDTDGLDQFLRDREENWFTGKNMWYFTQDFFFHTEDASLCEIQCRKESDFRNQQNLSPLTIADDSKIDTSCLSMLLNTMSQCGFWPLFLQSLRWFDHYSVDGGQQLTVDTVVFRVIGLRRLFTRLFAVNFIPLFSKGIGLRYLQLPLENSSTKWASYMRMMVALETFKDVIDPLDGALSDKLAQPAWTPCKVVGSVGGGMIWKDLTRSIVNTALNYCGGIFGSVNILRDIVFDFYFDPVRKERKANWQCLVCTAENQDGRSTCDTCKSPNLRLPNQMIPSATTDEKIISTIPALISHERYQIYMTRESYAQVTGFTSELLAALNLCAQRERLLSSAKLLSDPNSKELDKIETILLQVSAIDENLHNRRLSYGYPPVSGYPPVCGSDVVDKETTKMNRQILHLNDAPMEKALKLLGKHLDMNLRDKLNSMEIESYDFNVLELFPPEFLLFLGGYLNHLVTRYDNRDHDDQVTRKVTVAYYQSASQYLKKIAESSKQAKNSSSAKKIWNCNVCTYENTAMSWPQCTMCGTSCNKQIQNIFSAYSSNLLTK